MDALAESRGRHPSGLGQCLDSYFAAVAGALQACGVITGPPQRTDSAAHLIGSIVIDCTALSPSTGEADTPPPAAQSRGIARHVEHPSPVVVAWDEDHGWAVGLHHDSAHSTRRYLHPDLLPTPTAVAEFVVGLAHGQSLGDGDPVPATRTGPPHLRLMQ